MRVPYSPFFVQQIRDGNVVSITSTGTAIQGRLKHAVKPEAGAKAAQDFSTEIPSFADTTELDRLLESHHVSLNAEPLQRAAPLWERFLFGVVPTLLFLLLLYWLFRKMTGRRPCRRARTLTRDEVRAVGDLCHLRRRGDRRCQSGAQRNRRLPPQPGAVPETRRQDPARRPPERRPGTGETCSPVRSRRGECRSFAFRSSSSRRCRIGASRVRDLFKKAKEAAPTIVFIDELDAIGRVERGRDWVRSEAREQTLNQILTEFDGFTPATDLDRDRRDVPTGRARQGAPSARTIRSSHRSQHSRKMGGAHPRGATRGVPLAPDVDLGGPARANPRHGRSRSRDLVNEAAVAATTTARNDTVRFEDFMSALDEIARRRAEGLLIDDDRRRTAYYEAGHALAGMLIPGADPAARCRSSLVADPSASRCRRPTADRFNYTDAELDAASRVLLQGAPPSKSSSVS